jgi:hypothetical protein
MNTHREASRGGPGGTAVKTADGGLADALGAEEGRVNVLLPAHFLFVFSKWGGRGWKVSECVCVCVRVSQRSNRPCFVDVPNRFSFRCLRHDRYKHRSSFSILPAVRPTSQKRTDAPSKLFFAKTRLQRRSHPPLSVSFC